MRRRTIRTWLTVAVCVLALVAVAAMLAKLSPGDTPGGNGGGGSSTGKVTTADPATCKHESATNTYRYLNSQKHVRDSVCKDCGKTLSTGMEEAHSYTESGYCSVCETRCAHDLKNQAVSISQYTDQLHIQITKCADCKMEISRSNIPHTYNAAHVCTICQHACTHANKTTDTGTKTPTTHCKSEICPSCGYTADNVEEEHVWKNGVCEVCQYVCKHAMQPNYLQTEPGYHSVINTCNYCKQIQTVNRVPCDFDKETHTCKCCQAACTHPASVLKTTYGNGTTPATHHKKIVTCSWCSLVTETEAAHLWNDTGACKTCGYECLHDITGVAPTYRLVGEDHRSLYTCKICKKGVFRSNQVITPKIANAAPAFDAAAAKIYAGMTWRQLAAEYSYVSPAVSTPFTLELVVGASIGYSGTLVRIKGFTSTVYLAKKGSDGGASPVKADDVIDESATYVWFDVVQGKITYDVTA